MFRKYSIISLKFLCAPVVWNAGHISFTKTTVSGYRFPKQALQSVLLKSYGKYKLWKALVIVLGLMCNSFHGEDIVGVLEWNGETCHWITQACESPGRQPVSSAGVGTSIFLASDGSCSAAGQSRSLIIFFFLSLDRVSTTSTTYSFWPGFSPDSGLNDVSSYFPWFLKATVNSQGFPEAHCCVTLTSCYT